MRIGIFAQLYNDGYNKLNFLFDANKLLVTRYQMIDWDGDGIVGGYDQFIYYIHNTDSGSDAMTVQVEVSNNGTDFFTLSGYVGGVNIAADDTNIFVSDQQHHFYRVRVKSTSSGNHATYKIYWNYVENL